jgi:hypothetical protein
MDLFHWLCRQATGKSGCHAELKTLNLLGISLVERKIILKLKFSGLVFPYPRGELMESDAGSELMQQKGHFVAFKTEERP